MNNNFIEVKFMVDINDSEQVKSLNTFIESLKGKQGPKVDGPITPATAERKPADIKTAAPKEEPKTEEVKEAKVENISPNVANGDKLDAIRKLISEKVADHRAAIKSKLGELGAGNATELAIDKHEEFYRFLSAL